MSSQKPTPNVPILSPVNPAYGFPSYFLKIHVSCNSFTPSSLPINPPYAFLFSSPVHTSCPAHLLLFHLISLYLMPCSSTPSSFDQSNIIWQMIRVLKFPISSFLQPPVIFCLLGENVYRNRKILTWYFF